MDSAIDRYVPMKKQGKRSKKKHLTKGLSERLYINTIYGGFINIRDGYRL